MSYGGAQVNITDLVNTPVSAEADVNLERNEGFSPLHAASMMGHVDVVKVLTDNKARVNIANKEGKTPLLLAAARGYTDVVKLLIDEGADVNSVTNINRSPLLIAALNGHIDVVRVLLSAGADVNKQGSSGVSPLHVACMHGFHDMVKLLLDSQAQVDIRNIFGHTPLFYAAMQGHTAVVKLLIPRGAKVNSMFNKNEKLRAMSHGGAQVNITDPMNTPVSAEADVNLERNEGLSPIHVASKEGHVDAVKVLIHNKARVNIVNKEGETPLLLAAARGHTDVVKLLIDEGADVNSVTNINRSPLLIAALNGHIDVVHVLLSAGADVNLPQNEGFSPLHAASQEGHVDVLKVLLDNNAPIDIRDNGDWTPIHFAALRGQTDVVKLLIDEGSDVNSVTDINQSSLSVAAFSGHIDVVRVLLSAGADVNLPRNDGFSPLHAASENGYVDIVNLLLDNGALIETRDAGGRTALHFSALSGQIEVIDVLVTRGADVNPIDYDGSSPLTAAVMEGHEDIALKLVQQHKADTAYAIRLLNNSLFYVIKMCCKKETILAFLCRLHSKDPRTFMVQLLLFQYITRIDDEFLVRRKNNEDALFEDFDSLCAWFPKMMEVVDPLLRQMVLDIVQFEKISCMLLDPRVVSINTTLYRDNISERDVFSYTGPVAGAGLAMIDLLFALSSDIFNCSTVVNLQTRSSLSSNGGDVDIEDINGLQAIHCAVGMRHVKLVELLIQHGANVDAADVFGNRPLHEAVCRPNGLRVVQLLVQHGAKLNVQNIDGKTPLHIAVERQRCDVIVFLLSQDADAGITDVWRNTPLHYVTSELSAMLRVSGFGEYFVKYLTKKHQQCMSLRNIVGVSALEHIAVHVNSVLNAAVYSRQERVLVAKTAYADCQGNTPLHRAVGVYAKQKMFKLTGNIAKLVDVLVCHGADINAQNNDGHIPLHVARGVEAITACWRHANHQSFRITDKQGRNFWHLMFLLRAAHEIEILPSQIWQTTAVTGGEDSDDNMSRTPLHYACRQRSCIVKEFVNRISDKHMNKQDKFGRTALHYAAIDSDEILMKLLESKKADGKIRDIFGKTAKQYWMMRRAFYAKMSLLRLQASSSYLARNVRSIPVLIEQCFVDRCSDSAQCQEELREVVRDSRASGDAISYAQNIYRGCRIDYLDNNSTQELQKEWFSETHNLAAAAENAALSLAMFEAIQNHVAKAMEYLANEISSEEDLFASKAILVGSAHEGTQIECCDEFDYNFVLTKLSRKCEVRYSPESPPGFIILKASTSDYDEDLFDNNGTLNTRIVKYRFETLVKRVLSSTEFCERTGLEFIDPTQDDILPSGNVSTKLHTYIKLAFVKPVNGYHVLHKISVDIVPALQINDWWPEDARRQDLCQTGECLIVFTQPQNKYPWIGWTEPHGFISFARAESRLLRECPQVVKAAYMVVKRMSKYFCHHEFFPSYVIKTALLWCLDEDGFRDYSTANSDEINGDELLRLVQKILRRLLCFAAQDYVPCYFMPKCHQPVWSNELYLKQFHVRLYRDGLSYKDLFSLNEQQSEDEVLQDIKSMFIFSHIMYWTVLSDTDELELFVPSTINPLREITYRHLPASLRRQMKTELYSRDDH